jgi:hypothetical protein
MRDNGYYYRTMDRAPTTDRDADTWNRLCYVNAVPTVRQMRINLRQSPHSRSPAPVQYISSRDIGCGTGRKPRAPECIGSRMTRPRFMEVIKHCNRILIGDPCHIIRSRKTYDEFLVVVGQRAPGQLYEWLPFKFHGITGQIYHTDHEGFFFDALWHGNQYERGRSPALLEVGSAGFRGTSCTSEGRPMEKIPK